MESSSPNAEDLSQMGPTTSAFHKYMIFWLSQNASLLGSSIVMFAITLTMADMIGENNTLISLAFFLSFIPMVLFSPFAGVVADKYNKKKIILISDGLQALLTTCLFFVMMFTEMKLGYLFIFNFLRSTCQAFHSPVGFTLLSMFVPKDKLTRINGLNFFFNNLINIIAGPFSVILLITLEIPLEYLLWIDVLSFGISVIPLLKLPIPKITPPTEAVPSPTGSAPPKESMRKNLADGFKVITSIPGMINVLIMALCLNFFFMPFDTLLINFVYYTHGGTPEQYALLTSISRIGMFIGAGLVTIKPKWHHWVGNMAGGILLSGSVILYMGLVPEGNIPMLYIGAFFIMIWNPVVNGLFQSLIQMKVPPEKMGRVISIVITFASLLQPIGMLIAGPIADALNSIKWTYIGTGALSIIATVLLLFQPKVIRLLNEAEKISFGIEEPGLTAEDEIMPDMPPTQE